MWVRGCKGRALCSPDLALAAAWCPWAPWSFQQERGESVGIAPQLAIAEAAAESQVAPGEGEALPWVRG